MLENKYISFVPELSKNTHILDIYTFIDNQKKDRKPSDLNTVWFNKNDLDKETKGKRKQRIVHYESIQRFNRSNY